jgi:hypothetical protein
LAEENRFKVGDYAKVIQSGHRQYGEIVELLDFPDSFNNEYPFRSKRLDATIGDIFGYEHLVRATPEEVAEAKRKIEDEKRRKELVVGAYVKLSGNSSYTYGLGGVIVDEIGKITNTHDNGMIIVDFPSFGNGWKGTAKDLVLVTKEEKRKAEESEKWAKIGRNIRQLKDGDVVRFLEDTGADDFPEGSTAVIKNVRGERFNFGHLGKYVGKLSWVELVAPVESVVNLSVSE